PRPPSPTPFPYTTLFRSPLRADALEPARAALDRTLDRVAEQYREQLAPAIQRVWQDEVESMRADLRMWLEQSAAAHAEWEPIALDRKSTRLNSSHVSISY